MLGIFIYFPRFARIITSPGSKENLHPLYEFIGYKLIFYVNGQISIACHNFGETGKYYGDNEIQTLHKPVWNDIYHIMINLFAGFL